MLMEKFPQKMNLGGNLSVEIRASTEIDDKKQSSGEIKAEIKATY